MISNTTAHTLMSRERNIGWPGLMLSAAVVVAWAVLPSASWSHGTGDKKRIGFVGGDDLVIPPVRPSN